MTATFPTSAPTNVAYLRPLSGGRGEMPLSEVDAELVVLSSLILGDGDMSVSEVRALLRPEQFFIHANRYVYEAVLELTEANSVVDLVTISSQLRVMDRLTDVGGTPYVTKILDLIPATGGLRDYVRLVVDAWAMREAGSIGGRIDAGSRQPVRDVGHFLDHARKSFEVLAEQHGQTDAPTDLLAGFKADLQRIDAEAKNPVPPCPTGVAGLDRIMQGGWWRKKLVVLGARPSTGKTAMALESLLTCAQVEPERGGGMSLLFSLELDAEEIRQRLVSIWSGLTSVQVKTCQPVDRIEAAMRDLSVMPLYIDDQAKSPSAIRASIRRHQRLADAKGLPLRMVAVDYLQLAQLDPGVVVKSEEERIATVSREFVTLRKAFKEVTWLVLAQLNRAVTGRKDTRPKMSDLRGSGQIEQDADTIALLHHEDEREREQVTMSFDKNRGLPVCFDVHLQIAQMTGQVTERKEGV